MSRMQIPYEFFTQGLVGEMASLAALGINNFYPYRAPQKPSYGFISYHPASGQSPTTTNDDEIVFSGGLFDVEIVLDRDGDVDDLAPIDDALMTLFHGKKFVSTASGIIESCRWDFTFDLPYDIESGLYPRRILRFAIVI
jgi:hypothetical protein